ncbi:MAG: hypothetical protein HY290_29795 [Planctomycetia bacterium]|nr:hypothetical protein [Planctomycetia bacterium]
MVQAAVVGDALKLISDDDVGFGLACLIAFGTSIGTTLLAFALVAVMGIAGIFVAAVLAAAILGAALSWLMGAEIKRAFAIAGLFMLVHLGLVITFTWLWS